ncbi:MAG: sterol desaturase family protein [Pyrinomonadaceae bacterium]|nr:sterol desaturase family protein [Pyrinomonadaceae bacterium]
MNIFFGQIFALFILFVIFTPIERIFALHKEKKVFRNGLRTDVLHFLFNRFLTDIGSFIAAVIIAILFSFLVSSEFQALVASQPFWLQFTEAVLIVNVCAYFAHRLAHTVPFLWRFHTVHHSSEQLDWLASARVHPLDQVFTRAVVIVPIYILGFTKEVFGAYLILSIFHGIFIHSNVRFRFDFLRGIITTPQYHHWHHSSHSEALNKNFAGQLPFLDILFGTYYHPKEKGPESYGIEELMPNGYLAQLKYPFTRRT